MRDVDFPIFLSENWYILNCIQVPNSVPPYSIFVDLKQECIIQRGNIVSIIGRPVSGTASIHLFTRNKLLVTPSSDRLIFSLLTVVVMENLIVSLDFLEFPLTYTCDGGNHSPRLVLKGLQAESVAVMVFNPFEKSCCSFTPWIIWNIPPLQVIPAGIPREGKITTPIPAVQGVTDYGTIGYTGPCPPHGQMIRYQFKVYGLDTMLALDPGSDKHQLISSMKGHVLQFGETVAVCTR